MSASLRDFLQVLEHQGHLVRVKRKVDPRSDLAAVMKRAEEAQKVVIFEEVEGSRWPVVNNILGSRQMLAIAFGTGPEDVVREFVRRTAQPIPPVVVDDGPVKEVVRVGAEAKVTDLPLVVHSEHDAAPYITAGIVIARDPETGRRNVSFNRMMLKDDHNLGIRMMPPQHLGVIQAKAEARGEPLPVAVAIGNHPFEMLAAATTLALGDDELEMAGGLHGEPVRLVRCHTVDLEVPANAEIVIEGEVVPNVREPEGPFGDFLQYYVPVMDNHVLRVKAITHRQSPVYQTIQAGSVEDTHLLALSREAQVYKALVNSGVRVRAVSLVPNILNCAIAVEKQSEGEPKNVAAAAFGAYPWLKFCVVVDPDVDVFNVADVWWAIATRANFSRGLITIGEAAGFPRDPFGLHRAKLAIDATAPLGEWQEFARKRVPGLDAVRLEDYVVEGA